MSRTFKQHGRNMVRGFKVISLTWLLVASSVIAEDRFAPAVRVQAKEEFIDVQGFRGAAPCFADFDGDGLKDLLVGQYEQSRLRIYRNVGHRDEPRFDDFDWFQANGEIVELPGGGLFRPQLVDLDVDGKLDIVAGSSSGMIFWYPRTMKNEFADAELLKLASGAVLNAGADSACHAVDWDGDGDTDLVVAGSSTVESRDTVVHLVENEGSPNRVSFAAPRPLEADGQPIRAQAGGAQPVVADWNSDGKSDLLLGLGNGSVLWYENTGKEREPELTQQQLLVDADRAQARALIDAGIPHRSSGGNICVADWNNDGSLDILIGDTQSETIQPEAPDVEDQLTKTRQQAAQVLSDYRRLRKPLGQETLQKKEFRQRTRKKLAQRLTALREKISELEKSMQPAHKYHGYVWLLRAES